MPELIIPPELDRTITRMRRADLDRVVGRVIADSKPAPAKPPRFGSLVSTTVRATSAGFVATTTGVVATGAEFGGGRGPKRSYSTHRNGTAYIVRRRTTQQLLPWLGTRGYALMPAMRRGLAGIRTRILDAVIEAAKP